MKRASLLLALVLLVAAPVADASGPWVIWELGSGDQAPYPLMFVADAEWCERMRMTSYVIQEGRPFGRPRRPYNTVCLAEGIVPAPAAEDETAWVVWTTSRPF